MDREQAKQYVKSQEPSFLTKAPKKINGRVSYICPVCNNGSGKDGDGIAYFKGKYKCFNCGLSEDVIGLWKIDKGITDDREAFKSLYEFYNINIDDSPKTEKRAPAPQIEKNESQEEAGETNFTQFFLQANKDLDKTDYYRGISYETLNRFYVGYVEQWKHPKHPNAPASPRLIIPITEYSYIARDTRDSLTEAQEPYKKQKAKGKEGAGWIFNFRALEEAKQPIVIVEGEIDALSIIDVGGEAVALGSTANVINFLEYIKDHRPAQPLILSLDNDQENESGHNPGQEAEERLARGLEEQHILFYRHNIAGNYKDANERLTEDREGLKMEIEKAGNIEQEEYKKSAVSNYLQSFVNGIAESVNTPCIKTNFKNLDSKIDGGLYEGLYIIGAVSSLGKTTLVLQIADQIAQTGQDVIIFSLEMARSELMSKSISRQTIIDVLENGGDVRNAKTSRGITAGSRYEKYSKEERELIKRSISKYGQYAEHLYIFQGIGDIGVKQVRDQVQKHYSLTGNKPIVIIDYLQILAPYNERYSDKQNTDKAVLELKRISRDYKIPLLAISSLNRTNYNTKISMEAFKESGAIEYSSDVLIGLQFKGVGDKDFDIGKAKRENPRKIELVILKNRSGAVMETVQFDYYALFNYFKETENEDVFKKYRNIDPSKIKKY